ncbi:MAG: histidine kinase [Acidobacteria bacterium]|nr:histidine kinase [Acidobacteriota bacterium]
MLRRRPAPWALAFVGWTMIGLFYSVHSGSDKYGDSVKSSLAQWYIWGAFTPAITALDRRLPAARDAVLQRALFHVPLSFLFTTLYTYAFEGACDLMGLPNAFALSLRPLQAAFGGAFHWNYLVYWLIVGVYTAHDYAKVLRERQVRAAELERLLAESRLNTLRSQLHPHFLFNTLNAISAHVQRDPDIAQRMLEQLGCLLRLSLEHAEEQEIPLRRELAFLDQYLALQKVRFEDRLDVEMGIEPATLTCLVPTFMLQPLVENAIKHGVVSRTARGLVRISAWRENSTLRLQVIDDGPGLPDGWHLETHQGVGLCNTMERLRRLYGSAHQFSIANRANGGVSLDVSLPLRAAAQPEFDALTVVEEPYG